MKAVGLLLSTMPRWNSLARHNISIKLNRSCLGLNGSFFGGVLTSKVFDFFFGDAINQAARCILCEGGNSKSTSRYFCWVNIYIVAEVFHKLSTPRPHPAHKLFWVGERQCEVSGEPWLIVNRNGRLDEPRWKVGKCKRCLLCVQKIMFGSS